VTAALAEARLAYEWRFPLYADGPAGAADDWSDDWYEALAYLLAERAPA
jgi:hypothetical protein